jgi:hypothetical protein
VEVALGSSVPDIIKYTSTHISEHMRNIVMKALQKVKKK